MTRAVTAVALVALTLAGCAKDKEQLGARIAIEKRTRGACFAPCKGSGAPPPSLNEPGCPTDAAAVECGFLGGNDEVRVSLAYQVDVAATTTPALPTLDLVANDVVIDPKAPFVFAAGNADGASGRPIAVARFVAPAGDLTALAFRASIADGVVVSSDSAYTVSSSSPHVAVERQVTEATKGTGTIPDTTVRCFAACEGSATVPDSLGEQCTTTTNVDCGFTAGQDLIRVSTTSGASVEPGDSVTLPTLALLGNDVTLDAKADFALAPHSGSDRYQPIGVARLLAPLTPIEALSFRASWPSQLTISSDAKFTVGPATVTSFAIDQCPPAPTDCALPSGIGAVTARVQAPPGFAGKTVSITSQVSGRIADPTKAESTTLVLDTDGKASGSVDLDVPAGVGRSWLLTATVEGLKASATVKLSTPADPLLGIAPGTKAPKPGQQLLPPRAVFEPDPVCRTYAISMSVPDAPSGDLSLEASIGTLNGSASPASVTLDGDNLATASWVLPDDDETPTAMLSLDVDRQRSAQLTLHRQPVLPLAGGGSLAAARKAFVLDETGSPDHIVLRGTLETAPKAHFGANSKLVVQAKVVSSVTTGLPCGTAMSESLIKCDPTATSFTARGGCFLTPLSVTVHPDGTYEVPLDAGVCFAGELEFTTLSKVYTSVVETSCIGELDQSAGLEPVGTFNLTFNTP
jgi:hypothetical protein